MDTNVTDGPPWLRRRHGMKAGSAGVPPAQRWHSLTPLLHPARPARAPRFRFSRAQPVPSGRGAGCRFTGKLSGHPTQRMRAGRPRSRRGASSQPSCSPRGHAPACRAAALPGRSYEGETPNRQYRRTTNGHEYRWTSLAATTSRDERRERGRPARTTLAQPHPSLPPGSTGNGATIPLQPSPGRSCRQGGRLPLHGETEPPPNAENAGETPALPEGHHSHHSCSSGAHAPACRAAALPGGSYEGETRNRQ